jgi:tRNA pseudouridine38-40 synthase
LGGQSGGPRPGASGRHVALIVSYAGGGFAGFQRQPRSRTVQACLEQALGRLAGQPVVLRAAGRTDAGVHAAGQVVDFWLPERLRIPTERLPLALAGGLPADIGVALAVEVPPGFHARYSAVAKRYRYLLWRAPAVSPFWRPYALHHPHPLDVERMRQAAAALPGRRDLGCFAGAARPTPDRVRTVYGCLVWEQGPWLGIEVEADGFLYRTVRAIAGTLLEVGRGAMTVETFRQVLASGRREEAGPSLPPHGLCLLWVRYPPGLGLPEPGDPRWPPPPGPPGPPGAGPGLP